MEKEIFEIVKKYEEKKSPIHREIECRMIFEITMVNDDHIRKRGELVVEIRRRMQREIDIVEKKFKSKRDGLLNEISYRKRQGETGNQKEKQEVVHQQAKEKDVTKKRDWKSKRAYALKELWLSEKNYVDDLETVHAVHMSALLNSDRIIPRADARKIFQNITDIQNINRILLDKLEEKINPNRKRCEFDYKLAKQIKDENGFGEILFDCADSFKIYAQYCNNYEAVGKFITNIENSNKQFAQFLINSRNEKGCRNLDLRSFLILPVQRICKYPLLIREIIRNTPSQWNKEMHLLEKALERFESVIEYVNEVKRGLDSIPKIMELKTSIDKLPFELQVPGRIFVFQGVVTEIRKNKTSKQRGIVLFSDMLLITKQQKNGQLLFHQVIPLIHLFIFTFTPESTNILLTHACGSKPDISLAYDDLTNTNGSNYSIKPMLVFTKIGNEKDALLSYLNDALKKLLLSSTSKATLTNYNNEIQHSTNTSSPKKGILPLFTKKNSSPPISPPSSPKKIGTQKTTTTIKIGIIGPQSSGKTSLCDMFARGCFLEDVSPTIRNNYKKITATIYGTVLHLSILDTGGDPKIIAVSNTWYEECQGFILVFSLDSEESLSTVSYLKGKFDSTRNGSSARPFLLVGTKSDLAPRRVTYDAALKLSKTLGCLYIETSSKTGHNVGEAFNIISTEIMRSLLFNKLDGIANIPHSTIQSSSSKNKTLTISQESELDDASKSRWERDSHLKQITLRIIEHLTPLSIPHASHRLPPTSEIQKMFSEENQNSFNVEHAIKKLDMHKLDQLLRCILSTSSPLLTRGVFNCLAKCFKAGLTDSELYESMNLILESPLFPSSNFQLLKALCKYLSKQEKVYFRYQNGVCVLGMSINYGPVICNLKPQCMENDSMELIYSVLVANELILHYDLVFNDFRGEIK